MATNALYSTMIRAGRSTFFVDLKQAKNGNKFLSISENKINGDERKRVTLRVFGDGMVEFNKAISDAVAASAE